LQCLPFRLHDGFHCRGFDDPENFRGDGIVHPEPAEGMHRGSPLSIQPRLWE
jgi:hypothetical protein